jgi:predicted dehydrogenase
LTYPADATKRKVSPVIAVARPKTAPVRLALIGAGNFTRTTHLPHLKALEKKVQVSAVCAATAGSAATLARQIGAGITATDYRAVLKDPSIDAVLITTRHDTHAAMTRDAIQAGKHVFVEKPLALTLEELGSIDAALRASDKPPLVMVGYNRRFAPSTRRLREALSRRAGPLVALYRVNAGPLAPDHWTQGAEGGGRLRGEACHMIDFFQAIVGRPLDETSATPLRSAGAAARPDENFAAQFVFEDGSLADLVYTSLGHSRVPKERVEIHWDGRTAVLDDFRTLTLDGLPSKERLARQDKGHLAALEAFLDAIIGGQASPVPWPELYASTQAAIELDAQVWGKPVSPCAES